MDENSRAEEGQAVLKLAEEYLRSIPALEAVFVAEGPGGEARYKRALAAFLLQVPEDELTEDAVKALMEDFLDYFACMVTHSYPDMGSLCKVISACDAIGQNATLSTLLVGHVAAGLKLGYALGKMDR